MSEARWFIVERDSISGFCELRRFPQSILINQIAIHPRSHGQGLGRKLLRDSLGASVTDNIETIFLDVFDHVKKAADWYVRIGFEPVSHSSWAEYHLKQIPTTGASKNDVIIRGLPQAAAVHRRMDFSEITVITSRGEYRVGRLGTQRYRVGCPEILNDRFALQALRVFEPTRSTMLIQAAPGKWLNIPGVKLLWKSNRMKCNWTKITKRFSQ